MEGKVFHPGMSEIQFEIFLLSKSQNLLVFSIWELAKVMCSCNGDIPTQSTSLTFSGPFSISIYHLFIKADPTIITVAPSFLPLLPDTEGSNSQIQIKMSSLFMKSCILTLFPRMLLGSTKY